MWKFSAIGELASFGKFPGIFFRVVPGGIESGEISAGRVGELKAHKPSLQYHVNTRVGWTPIFKLGSN